MPAFLLATARLSPHAPSQQSTAHRAQRHAKPSAETLRTLSVALHSWHKRTRTPSNRLPTDSDLRRCQIAKELSLRTLITRAGGHRSVQSILNLSPPPTSRQRFQHSELLEMASSIRSICVRHSLPPPEVEFPSQRIIRDISPSLANRIAAFPGRDGYGRLAEFVKTPLRRKSGTSREWGVWTQEAVLTELRKHQTHPRVLPRLCMLPTSIAAAIQRSGGAAVFAQTHKMVLEKHLTNVARFASLVQWLSQQVQFDETGGYVDGTKKQALLAPPLPATKIVDEGGKAGDLARYGGRRSMAVRLGFAKENGIKGLFMGPFSVRLAADVLEYAVQRVLVCDDGSIGMPTMESLRADGRQDLADAVEYFGGEVQVGRRVGLVPQRLNRNAKVSFDKRLASGDGG